MGCAPRPGWQRGCLEGSRLAQRQPGTPGRRAAADDGAVTLRTHRGAWRGAVYPDSYPRGGLQAIASQSIELSDASLWRPWWRLPDPFVWRRGGARPSPALPLLLHTRRHTGGRVGKCDDCVDVQEEKCGFLRHQVLERRAALILCVIKYKD